MTLIYKILVLSINPKTTNIHGVIRTLTQV